MRSSAALASSLIADFAGSAAYSPRRDADQPDREYGKSSQSALHGGLPLS
jgi:hypothetical protein